ncbi:MAG: putative hemolysin [Alphaproteobacteria bacterium]
MLITGTLFNIVEKLMKNLLEESKVNFQFESDSYQVRFAESQDEILQAQALRYHVFYELMGATPSPENALSKCDFDRFDPICDHLLVIDKNKPDAKKVVGNYRLLCAPKNSEPDFFYSHCEYDLTPFTDRAKEHNLSLMELGRSCVHPDYRNNPIVIQLLWRGLTTYAVQNNIDLLFGCASFADIDQNNLQKVLSYLHHKKSAPPHWRVSALPELYQKMNYIDITPENEREILQAMPPLIKGYLRLGAWIGDGAVVDKQFGTTDVLITLPLANIPKRYIDFFTRS